MIKRMYRMMERRAMKEYGPIAKQLSSARRKQGKAGRFKS